MGGERRSWSSTWELVAREPTTVGDAVEAFRDRLGGPAPLLALPLFFLKFGAVLGDLAAHLGWAPPVRTTALAEMRRGVVGDPGAWMRATGIAPLSLQAAVAATPATVQERWFARLFLLKPLIIAGLSLFWIVSGLIALIVSFRAAAGIFVAHGFPVPLANALTVVSSLMDIGVGLAIGVRRSHRSGLLAGIALSLLYMGSAALLTPELWIEPLGALVKTGPAIILMLVALAIGDDR